MDISLEQAKLSIKSTIEEAKASIIYNNTCFSEILTESKMQLENDNTFQNNRSPDCQFMKS